MVGVFFLFFFQFGGQPKKSPQNYFRSTQSDHFSSPKWKTKHKFCFGLNKSFNQFKTIWLILFPGISRGCFAGIAMSGVCFFSTLLANVSMPAQLCGINLTLKWCHICQWYRVAPGQIGMNFFLQNRANQMLITIQILPFNNKRRLHWVLMSATISMTDPVAYSNQVNSSHVSTMKICFQFKEISLVT